MSGPDEEDALPCVTQQSADKLKFTISFAGSKGHSSEGRSVRGRFSVQCYLWYLIINSDVAPEVTSRNLFLVLSDVHSQLVRRDPKGIFAHPVTDDIAAGYSQVSFEHPLSLGMGFFFS
ncbi:hypothetical protein FBUS_11446 [Fasciolopsis buskii]|uniref:Uncharacterized protein n=1 Tax=Fasciolopsis buskii TaxID=27845 RepID=A0A8E0VMC5_9TREM|nr:hypothetical protein FBUS_11446 [Fasciolopsis buski]